jgi:hypothetical protein
MSNFSYDIPFGGGVAQNFYLLTIKMALILPTPWCKDCWFLDTCSNLIRCAYHHKVWVGRTELYRRRTKKLQYIPDDHEVDKEVVSK